MEIKLSRKWVDKMKKLPESGMGYQLVEVKLKDGSILKGIVTNCNILEVTGLYFSFSIRDIEKIDLL